MSLVGSSAAFVGEILSYLVHVHILAVWISTCGANTASPVRLKNQSWMPRIAFQVGKLNEKSMRFWRATHGQ